MLQPQWPPCYSLITSGPLHWLFGLWSDAAFLDAYFVCPPPHSTPLIPDALTWGAVRQAEALPCLVFIPLHILISPCARCWTDLVAPLGLLHLHTINILYQINSSLCGVSYTLWDVQQHPWPLFTKCLQHFPYPAPKLQQPAMSPGITICHLGENCLGWEPLGLTLRCLAFNHRPS